MRGNLQITEKRAALSHRRVESTQRRREMERDESRGKLSLVIFLVLCSLLSSGTCIGGGHWGRGHWLLEETAATADSHERPPTLKKDQNNTSLQIIVEFF